MSPFSLLPLACGLSIREAAGLFNQKLRLVAVPDF
jgi:hypothetical protein